ncbi:MAG TPA: glycosyltransferase family 4 protein [Nitrospira sp.]|nr:glycosyltransferase family 4 protein [Nitrospira sp.]
MTKPLGRVLMFVENRFPGDVRVKNEADMLTAAGYSVTVVGLREEHDTAVHKVVDKIQVYLVPRVTLFTKTRKDNPSGFERVWLRGIALLGYAWEYVYFTGACFLMSLYIALRHGFDVIHAHNPPDTLFLVAAVYKPFGVKFVFDHHDLCPELYQSRYRAAKGVLAGILGLLEKASLTLADVTIATNESYRKIQIQRGKVKPENVFVVRNGPNLRRVALRAPSERLRTMNKSILCYVGALNPQDGVDYLLRSLGDLVYKLNRKDFYCVVMGNGDSLEDLRALARELNLDSYVELTGYISEEDLMRNLSAADICVDPDPSSPLNDVSTWIKIMEYMALGKPIVTYDLKETRWSAQDAALYITPNDELAFAEGIATLMDRPDLREKMGEFGRRRIETTLKWDIVGQNLVHAYAALLGHHSPSPSS